MSPRKHERSPETRANLTAAQATRLLRLGMTQSDRPVDDIVVQLQQVDAVGWLDLALASRLGEDARAVLLDSAAPLDTLKSLKKRAQQCAGQDNEEQRLMGIAAYFLCLAAALAHHETLITRQPRADVITALRDLASELEEPWAALIASAIRAADRLAD